MSRVRVGRREGDCVICNYWPIYGLQDRRDYIWYKRVRKHKRNKETREIERHPRGKAQEAHHGLRRCLPNTVGALDSA